MYQFDVLSTWLTPDQASNGADLACHDGGLEPKDVIGTYQLTSYLGQPLPVVVRVGGLQPPKDIFSGTPPGCETLLESARSS